MLKPGFFQAVSALAVLFAATAPVHAGSPSLGRIMPRGGQRGTEVVADFTGARLQEARGVLFSRAGITVKKIEQVNDGHVKCTLAIASDCPPGIHPMRLFTATGITELRRFTVGGSPEISEAESNNDRTKPQAVKLPVTINGTVTSEDVDYFAFAVRAGERINLEIEAMRLGDTVFDPHLAVLDTRGAILANADDTSLVRQDAIISHTFETAGTYVAEVREASYRGNANSHYRLHIGAFPRPQGVFPPGGRLGRTIEVRWLGDAKLATEKITLPKDFTPDFGLTASDAAGVSPSPVPFRLSRRPQTAEVEPNDAPDKATACTVPGDVNGVLSKPGDVDWYQFVGKKGQVFNVRLYGRQLRSPIDSVMGIHKRGGGRIAGNDDSGGPDSGFRFTVPADGEYVLYVHDLLKRGGALYTYRVEITPVSPVLTLSTPKTQQHCAVPQGNRNAILINAGRSDFGGPLNVTLSGMPAGLTLHATTMRANVSSLPVVLEAAADAKLAGAQADVVGRHADAKRKIEGHLRQALRLTAFRNSTMAEQIVNRLPVAVTEKVPFSIRIEPPKVPLVRRGHMNLKVIAARAEGFKKPIHLRILWNPPGVGSGTAKIAAGKTEAALYLNANNGAALGGWPLVAVATADVGGAVQVSSQLAKLSVAEPFVDMAIERTRVTQAESAEVIVKITKKVDFEGEGKVVLRGLPGKVTAPEGKITKNAAEIKFAVQAAKDAPVGLHKGLFVQTTVTQNGVPIVFNSAAGELFVDKPLPPKKNEPKKKAPPKPQGKGEKKKKRVRLPRARGGSAVGE